MDISLLRKLKYLFLPLMACLILCCRKEHLQPPIPEGEQAPVVYITAKLDDDSVYFAGGVDYYAGSTSVFDTLIYRSFGFTLQNTLDSAHSYFQILINNYQSLQGNLQNDLDSSIFADVRHYQYPHNINHFIPLAVTVNWIDSAGKKFSSDGVEQVHFFSINTVEDVLFDGKKYKEVTVEFDCTLDAVGDVIHLTNGKGTLLFGVD